MDVIQNIFGAIMLLLLIIFGAIMYTSNLAKDIDKDIDIEQDTFRRDIYSTDLNTIIKLSEPISQKEYGRLIADSIYYRTDNLTFSNITINITKDLKGLLDCSLGEDRYFLEAEPRIVLLSLNFILDGSKTLKEERATLASQILELKEKMRKKVNETLKISRDDRLVVINIYSLLDNEICENEFNISKSDPDINCYVIQEDDMYYVPAPPNTSSVTIDDESLQTFKERYNMTHPFNETWRNATTLSSRLQYISSSDWGYGTAYAIYRNNRTDLSKITIFFPMSDQLSTSSINEDCFWLDAGSGKNDCAFPVCSICMETCSDPRSIVRSDRSIQAAINASKDYNAIINPIYSYNCDYENIYYFGDNTTTLATATPDSGWNACDDAAMCGSSCGTYGSDPQPTWCSQASCTGCSEAAGGVCFHDECTPQIQSHMDLMAQETGGGVINLQNISQMNLDIENVIENNLDEYAFRIGSKDFDRVRDVVERTIPMPNNVMIDIRLWVYKDTENATRFNCSFLD
jgi:hypothetical protein